MGKALWVPYLEEGKFVTAPAHGGGRAPYGGECGTGDRVSACISCPPLLQCQWRLRRVDEPLEVQGTLLSLERETVPTGG